MDTTANVFQPPKLRGLKINTQNTKNVIRFIKDIKEYTIEQVEVWLENGKMP